jgi:hypothetical protein
MLRYGFDQLLYSNPRCYKIKEEEGKEEGSERRRRIRLMRYI